MDIVNSINEIFIKNDKETIFYYGFIMIVIISLLQNIENVNKYIIIILFGYFIILYLNNNLWKKSENKIILEEKKYQKGQDYELWKRVLGVTDCIYIDEHLTYYDIGHGNGREY